MMGVVVVIAAPTIAQAAGLFVHPGLAVAGAAAVAVPIVIHLLARARRRTQPWAAMRFLAQAMSRQRTRLRLQNWLLLLTRCLLVLLLGLALSRPLTGAWAALGGRDVPRYVAVMIDDSLASSAPLDGEFRERSRFDRSVRAARAMLETLDSGARVVLLPLSQAARGVTELTILTSAEALQILDGLSPTYGPMQPQTTYGAAVQALMDELAAAGAAAAADCVLVVASHQPPAILDAFSRLEVSPDHAAPRLLVTRPVTSVDNVQIAALRPMRQRVYAAAAGDAALGVEVDVRRYGDVGAALPLTVAMTLHGPDGQRVSAASGRITLAPGQTQTHVNLMLDASWLPVERGTPWVLEATLQAEAIQAANALADDDAQRRWLQPSGPLRVALIDRDQTRPDAGELRPAQWWWLALRPRGDVDDADEAAVSVRAIDPQVLAADDANVDRVLRDFDAAVVLRADVVSEAAASALAQWTQRGGVLWVQPPADGEQDASARMESLFAALGFAGRVGSARPAMSSGGWSLNVDAPPPALQLLAAEWDKLLAPIRVHRVSTWHRVVEHVADRASGDETVWLSLAAGGDVVPWLIHRPLGEGHVLLLLSAVDADWTNLPTRPLFVPLVHESLRALAGSVPLAGAWGEVMADTQPPSIQWSDRVLVNVASEAGDTTAVAADALGDALDRLTSTGRVSTWAWLDADNAVSALMMAAGPTGRDLGRPLLGAVLLLAVGELLLARWLSHEPPPRYARGAEGGP